MDTGSAQSTRSAGAIAPRPHAPTPPRAVDPAQRGAAPISSEAKRRVRLAENQRKGFESAWNEYFDCYASTTYVEEPLIRLEDVSYHLYLKKHINPTNPRWELPSFRQLKKILGLSQDKLQGIEARLATARLLVKDSGKGKGAKGENVANDYLLYEPLELADFLLGVANGHLPGTLNEKGRRKLAEIRARFCEVGSGRPEGESGWDLAAAGGEAREAARGAGAELPTAAPAAAGSRPLPHPLRRVPAHRPLPPSAVSEIGTGGGAQIGTPGEPTSGAVGVPEIGTAPAPGSGTYNTRRLTPLLQQTMQQQTQGAATPFRPEAACPAPEGGDAVVVVGSDRAVPGESGLADTPSPTAAPSDPLVERGITPLIARRLRQNCPAERIDRQVAIFDALRALDPADPKLTPGRLRRQIEEDWSAPAEYAPTAGRGAALAEVATSAVMDRADSTDADPLRRIAEAAAARQGRLAAIGLGEDDQALWARVVQAAPVLPPLFRSALLHAPQGTGPAVVIFASRADCERAQSPVHAATRARVAARLAAAIAPGAGRGTHVGALPVRYLAYDDLLALLQGND